MDSWDEKKHVLNIRVAKLTGLYQILNPGTIKFRGQNVYHIIVANIVLFVCVIVMVLLVSGLYYWSDSILVSLDYGWKGITALFLTYKMWNVVYNSDDIWNCLTITRYDFTSHSLRNRHILDRWRERSVWITNVLTIMYSTSIVFFAGSSLMFRDDISTVKNHDGSIGNYRQNLVNLYLLVADKTYNANYETFYFIESLYTACLAILFLVFDILLVTLCLAVSCQIQMVNAAFESVGNKSLSDPHTQIADDKDEKKYISNEQNLIYDELISIIMDHQAVIKKYYELLTLFRRLILFQVFYSSTSLIVIWFCFIMSFSTEDRFIAPDVTTIKIICIIPSISFQLFLVCSLFDDLHEQIISNCYSVVSFLINYVKVKYG